MDLGLIFGLNSRFGAVLGRISVRFRTAFCSRLLNSFVYQRVTGPLLLELSLRQRSGFAGQ
jgi:hypothetical protein